MGEKPINNYSGETVNTSKLLTIKDEILTLVKEHGKVGEYTAIEIAYSNYSRLSSSEFKKNITYHLFGTIENLLLSNLYSNILYQNSSYHSKTEHNQNINALIEHLYDKKIYYTINQNEYGEHNENKIFNKQCK